MADISSIKLNDTDYDIKDAVARGNVLTGTIPAGEVLSFTSNGGLLCASHPYDGSATPSAYGCGLYLLYGSGGERNGKETIFEGGAVTFQLSGDENAYMLTDSMREVNYILIGATIID